MIDIPIIQKIEHISTIINLAFQRKWTIFLLLKFSVIPNKISQLVKQCHVLLEIFSDGKSTILSISSFQVSTPPRHESTEPCLPHYLHLSFFQLLLPRQTNYRHGLRNKYKQSQKELCQYIDSSCSCKKTRPKVMQFLNSLLVTINTTQHIAKSSVDHFYLPIYPRMKSIVIS